MHRSVKATSLLTLAILFLLTLSSCDKNEEPARTPELEQQEIEAALQIWEKENYDIQTTELGSYYVVLEDGEGEAPVIGDEVSILYNAYFIDGTLFDASIYHYADGIWTFEYGDLQLIPGFDEAIGLLVPGQQIEIIIPSRLAYGSIGNDIIPPYQPLLYSIKLESVN